MTTGQEGEHREKDDSLKSSVVSEVLELRTDAKKTHPNGGDQVKGNGAANADAAPEEEAETVQLSDPNRLFAKRYLEKLVYRD